jgi:hypothetical protein
MCFITSQWFTSLHPGVRSNADIVKIFALQSANEIESVWKQYFGWFPKDEFPALLDRYTGVRVINGKKRHLFLAVDNRAKGVAGIDRTFWGFAEEAPDFLLGSEEYWGDELDEKLAKMEQRYRELDTPAYELEPDVEGAMGAYVGQDPNRPDTGGKRRPPLPCLEHRRKRTRG